MMVSKAHILAEIERTAAENGGKPLGVARFRAETGIGQGDWGRHWARWGDAIREAGMEPNQLQGRFSDDVLLAHLAAETRRLGHMPTSRELNVRHVADAAFPDAMTFQRWRRREMVERLAAYCQEAPDRADVLATIEPELRSPAPARSTASPPRAGVADAGSVYLIKMGRHYKIGRTNAVGRREYELAIQLPERAQTVHVIPTDDPAGIEAYWHHRFKDRRGNGEWFALTADDVAAFRRRKFM